MEDQSFSLQFNPLQRIKSVKDYEREIEELRNENFGLKHQLSHYRGATAGNIQEDIQRLLLDSKKSIDILEGENEALNKQIENMQEAIRTSNEEKAEVERRLTNSTHEYAGKISMLEDENNRLLKHLENVNEANSRLRAENKNVVEEQKRYIDEILRERDVQFEKEISSYKNALLNCNKEKEQIAYELERRRDESGSRTSQLQKLVEDLENRIKMKDSEVERMKKYYEDREKEYEAVCRQRQSDEMYLREMSENYTRETKEKQELALRNEDLRREVEELKMINIELKKRVEVVENEKRALSYKVSGDVEVHGMKMELERRAREWDRRLNDIERLADEVRLKIDSARDILCNPKRYEHEQIIDSLRHEVKNLKRMMILGDDNKRFLRSLDIDELSFDETVERLKVAYKEMTRKMSMMDKEINEMTNFADKSRTVRFLEDFTNEFNVAKKDLEACKRYLERKGRENKELKADKLRLEVKFDECKRNEERMRHLYSTVSNKLRKKDEVISKLETRIGSKF